MTRRHSLLFGLMLAGATNALPLPALSDPPAKTVLPLTTTLSTPAKKAHVAADFGRLPLAFESNQGQTAARVRFLTHTGDSTLFLTPSEAVFSLAAPASTTPGKQSAPKKDRTVEKRRRVALRMQMMGANPKATPLAQQPLAGRVNYFLGHDARNWHAGVPTFGRVGFHQVYPGVDVVYYGNQRHLEYDFVVAPHADPKQIRLHFAGAQCIKVNTEGDLLVRAQGRELRWQKPAVYQQDATGKHAVAARFRLKKLPTGQTGVSFVVGHYDGTRPLVIDPVLLYSTFLSGSAGNSNGNYARAIAVDSNGSAYVTGYTWSTNFPTTSGAFQEGNNGQGTNALNTFVTKFNSTGTALVYSTYLGGSSAYGDMPSGITVDGSGNAYVTGFARSTDFPTTQGAFQTVLHSKAGYPNAFVTKINASGSALLYSTYLGGSSEEAGNSVAVDSNGNAYVAGFGGSTDFPTTPGALQSVRSGNGDNAFVTKLNATGTALVYSTFLGGTQYNSAFGIAIDSSDNAYVAGTTTSTDFPTTPGAFQQVNGALGGSPCAFVSKINATGTALIYSSYLGGSRGTGGGADGIAIDGAGNAYITGYTESSDFPTTSGAFQRVNKRNATTAFVTKLNPGGTALVYSTYLGGSDKSEGHGIAIDAMGNAYVAGYTYDTDFPTTPGALQRVHKAGAGISVSFITKLNPVGTALLYSTYLGGSSNSNDSALGIAVDNNSNAYVTGFTFSADFPTTPGAFQQVKNTMALVNSAFVVKLSTHPIFPDFNNDGSSDLLIQNTSTGAIASWFMQGSTWVGGAYFSLTPPSGYALVGVGDFSGNGSTTLVLQSRTTNQIAFWYTSGANNATIPGGNFLNVTPDAGWMVVGVGDFNGDGKSDLVLQNQTTNQVAIWFMNGYLYQGGILMPFTPPSGWIVAGVGDFNTDGFPDIAFQNQTTGQIALWYMNGPTYAGGTVMTTVPASGWKVVGVGDYNGDGSADLLFQNQTINQAAVWYLQNGAFVGGDVLSLAPPSGWKIAGPR